jgi:hypothetical protein
MIRRLLCAKTDKRLLTDESRRRHNSEQSDFPVHTAAEGHSISAGWQRTWIRSIANRCVDQSCCDELSFRAQRPAFASKLLSAIRRKMIVPKSHQTQKLVRENSSTDGAAMRRSATRLVLVASDLRCSAAAACGDGVLPSVGSYHEACGPSGRLRLALPPLCRHACHCTA